MKVASKLPVCNIRFVFQVYKAKVNRTESPDAVLISIDMQVFNRRASSAYSHGVITGNR